MTTLKLNTFVKIIALSSCLLCSACVGTVIGTVVDATIEVVKIPFKVGGAVIDVVSGGDEFDENAGSNKTSNKSRQTTGDSLNEQVSF